MRITWSDVMDFVEDIKNLHELHKFTGVYGLPRGGCIPAVIISNKLNIPYLAAPCEGCIIVDDIADTGRSLCHYTQNETQFNKYFIATLVYNPARSVVEPNYYMGLKTDDSDWVVFPWEV